MKKTKEKITTVIEIYCDDCTSKGAPKNCYFCKKDLCKVCVIEIYDMGDYPDRWCKRCWDLTEPIRVKLKNAEQVYNKVLDEIEVEENKIKESLK